MTSFARILALSFLIAAPLAACGNDVSSDAADGDGVISVKSDDAEMNAAIAKARATLPTFWKAFANPTAGDSDFALKVRIVDGARSSTSGLSTSNAWTARCSARSTTIPSLSRT